MNLLKSIKAITLTGLFGGVLCALGFIGYLYQKQRMEASYYRKGIQAVVQDYQHTVSAYNQLTDQFNQLKRNYNEVLAQTAITEIDVEGENCFVVFRNAEKIVAKIPVSVDLNKEVFVDYVQFDNKLFIRRIFDSGMAPESAPDLFAATGIKNYLPKNINWEDNRFKFGKNIYRKLGEGTWVISVSGGGSLQIDKKDKQSFSSQVSVLEGVNLKPFKKETAEIKNIELNNSLLKYSRGIGIVEVLKYTFQK